MILFREVSQAPAVQGALDAFLHNTFPLALAGIEGTFREILVMLMARKSGRTCFLVLPTEREAEEAAANITALGGDAVLFPSWSVAPYHPAAPLSPVFATRAALLARLASGNAPSVVIIALRTFLAPLVPPESLRGTVITLSEGGVIDTQTIAAALNDYGYIRVPKAQMPGEFVLRGEVLDIFCGGGAAGTEAVRILFDFDTIESIRLFDPVEQNYLNQEKLPALVIPPVKELIWTDERIDTLSEHLAALDEFRDNGAAIIDELITKRTMAGEEYFFHLAFRTSAAIVDYAAKNTCVFFAERERLENAVPSLLREYEASYRAAMRDHPGSEFPAPGRLLLPFEELTAQCPNQVSLLNLSGSQALHLHAEPPQSFFGNINYLKETLTAMLDNNWTIYIAGETETQTERLTELLKELGGGGHQPVIVHCPLSAGFSLPEIKLAVIAEAEIFGRRARKPASLKTARSRALDSFVELNVGDYVVHLNYGIGLFLGIERLKAMGNERDYIKLRYADEETVFVPIEQVNLVQRYIGNEGAAPKLDSLGSKNWEARKERARKAAEDLAARLVTLYSKRKAATGFAFAHDTEWQTMFEASFPYEETADQLRCVEEIKADMEKPVPMDRLVCGDVGYGKTEVALRACFKAIMSGKQAAFLAPTTILVEQHYENFKIRFAQFPVRIAMLSRFVDGRTARKTVAAVAAGEVDILVGTHRIIQKDIAFKDLGLLIIDEEQRFGVKDKERLKEFKHNVDSLALSATPIPRTLHMSLLKIRDMSLLTTAPRNRRPIETHIGEYDETMIAQAIRAESARGGQIFFLHNKIENLREVRIKLEKLVPEMLIETAHGQMEAAELENIMRRFIQGGFHVLVSTTIIENGIDIPNVNTIIIDRADMYGISQLYQLRGRVGRSDRAAYAYLFYPRDRALSELAMKRLQAMSDFTELGAGFKIAMKDMEIRGAGNLLGRDQSGNIYSVGYDTYLRLLDTAIQKLQNTHYEAEVEPLLELEYSGFIPDSYIAEAQEKMEVYKKIAAVQTRDELDMVVEEMRERFGPPPAEAASLLALSEIKIICKQLAVLSLKEHSGIVRVEFARVARIDIERTLRLVKESAGRVRLDPRAPNVLMLQTGAISLAEKSAFVCEKLSRLV